MKIAVDIRCLMNSNRSGVGEYTYQVLDHLFKVDRENRYILFYNSWKKINADFLDWQKYENVELKKYRLPNKIFNLLQFFGVLKLDKLCGNVDIFWLPNWHLASFSDDVKVKLTVHDLSSFKYPEFLSLKRKLWHRLLRIEKLLNRTDEIISVSQSTTRDLKSLFGTKSEKIKTIHSGVIPAREIEAGEVESLKNKFNLQNDFILYLGTLEPRKNLIGLVRAFDKFCLKNKDSQIDLVLAGGEGWKCRRLKKEIARRKSKNRIKLIGYVEKNEKDVLYSLAKILVYPSFYEGFGFPPIEAMSYGCPVISSLNSSLPEVVGSAGVMVDPLDDRDLSLAIESLLFDMDLRRDLIEKGVGNVRRFSWSGVVLKQRLEIKI